MTTKQPEFDPHECLMEKYYATRESFCREREIDRHAALDAALKAITVDVEGIDDTHWGKIRKILNRLWGKK